MRAKDIIPASKPRNFVAKNQKTAGAGAHKDKKKAAKQGDVKHKKKEVDEGWKDIAAAGALAAGMALGGGHAHASDVSDLSHFSTPYLQKVASGEHPRPLVSIDDAKKELEARRQQEGLGERVRDPEDWDEGNTEPPNNFAVYINGKKWKVFKGRGYYADDERERAHYYQLQDWARKKSAASGKKWTVHITGEAPTE